MSDLVDLGPFRPERLLANGTRTQVWAAVGPNGQPAAVKLARGDEIRVSLQREIAIYKKLDCPGVPRMLGAADDGKWLAMERVEGAPIDRWARQAREKTLAEVGVQILEVLHHLHNQGCVHGDLKPSNVLIDEQGNPSLVDFGSAMFLDKPTKGFRGTLGFAAPELLAGEPPTIKTDLYGFGALLYACLTERPPFVLPDPAALAYVPTVSLPAPPSTWVPGIPARIDHLVMALLARDPKRRPSDARAVSQTLLTAPRNKMAKRVLGMHDERDVLRRAVVAASQGQPQAVVVYGPPGSGRLTLITETVEAAVREGLTYLQGVQPMNAEAAVAECDGVPILVFRTRQKNVQVIAQQLLEANKPMLLLLHSDRPLPRLTSAGAQQLTPPPLTRTDATQLVATLGGDMSLAEKWRDEAQGLPSNIIGRCRAWLRARDHQTEPDLDTLPQKARKVFDLVVAHGEISIADISTRLHFKELSVVDYAEVLFAEGLVVSTQGGANLKIAPALLGEAAP